MRNSSRMRDLFAAWRAPTSLRRPGLSFHPLGREQNPPPILEGVKAERSSDLGGVMRLIGLDPVQIGWTVMN